MNQSIDVTGLSSEAVRTVESLVGMLREQAAKAPTTPPSIFDLIGTAPKLRTSEDIAAQFREERDAWGES
jgi:hypothetical protein